MSRKIIAVDFDGTLSLGVTYPNIGIPNKKLISWLNEQAKNGAALILWTCRNGEHLKKAVEFCKLNGLIFDAINENLPEHIRLYGRDTRKIYATMYIDDKNYFIKDLIEKTDFECGTEDEVKFACDREDVWDIEHILITFM